MPLSTKLNRKMSATGQTVLAKLKPATDTCLMSNELMVPRVLASFLRLETGQARFPAVQTPLAA